MAGSARTTAVATFGYASSAIIVASAALAYWGAHAFILAGNLSDPKQTAVIHLPEFGVWVGILSGEVAIWTVIAAQLVAQGWRLRRRYRVPSRTYVGRAVLTIVAVVMIIWIPLGVAAPQPSAQLFYRSGEKVATLYWIGIGVSSLGIVVFTLIDQIARRIIREDTATEQVIGELADLQTTLKQTLGLLGITVSLLIIGTGAYMNAVRAFRQTSSEAALLVAEPRQPVLIAYGSVFVIALLAMYLPASSSVKSAGLSLVDRVLDDPARFETAQSSGVPPMPQPAGAGGQSGAADVSLGTDPATDVLTRLKQRADLRSALGVDSTVEQSLRGAVAVLSPLITSAFAVFLGA